MYVVIVKFKISKDLDKGIIKSKFEETAPMYQDTKGLIRKNYLFSASNNTAGGVYIFDNSKNAHTWFDKERIDWLTERFSSPDITYYDSPVEVNNETNKIVVN